MRLRVVSTGVIALATTIGIGGCVLSGLRYPSEYPPADSHDSCPNISGSFANIGIRLGSGEHPEIPISLTNLVFVPGGIPSDAGVTTVRIQGPEQDQLEIAALSAEKLISEHSMSVALQRKTFFASVPFTSFLCRINHIETMSSSYSLVLVYRAKDGSLIVSPREFGIAPPIVYVRGEWFRFAELVNTR